MIESLLGAILVICAVGVYELRRIRRAILRGNLDRKLDALKPVRVAR
jgi:hypothetical protein